jgi:hypothetical protein
MVVLALWIFKSKCCSPAEILGQFYDNRDIPWVKLICMLIAWIKYHMLRTFVGLTSGRMCRN